MQKSQNQVSEVRTETLISKSFGCCSTCFKVIPSEIVERNGKVFMLKECCSKEEVLIENDVEFYKKSTFIKHYERSFYEIAKNRYDGWNREVFRRASPSLLISVTLKCNLDCPICMNTTFPSQVNHHTDFQLSIDQIKKILKGHKGKIVTIWGGEPTLRADLPEIIRAVKESGNTCTLCTNGLRCLDLKYCEKLKESGLDYLDLQFDGFRDDIYVKLRGVPLLEKKMKILENLKKVKMKTALIAVIGKNINEDQIPLLVKFASMDKNFLNDVQFIELYTGNFGDEERVTQSDIHKILETQLGIPTDLYIQSRRLYFNISKFILKVFGEKYSLEASNFTYPNVIYIRKTESGLEPYFSLDWLNKMNEILEESIKKDKLHCITNLVKNTKLFLNYNFLKIASPVVLNGFNHFKAGKSIHYPDLMKINFSAVKSPLNEDLETSNPKEELIDYPVITNANAS